MTREESDWFTKAVTNAVAWQNRCCELDERIEHLLEIIEMFCLDAEITGAKE